MNKSKTKLECLFLLSMFALLPGCVTIPSDDNSINATQEILLSGDEMYKLTYVLEGIIDPENDPANSENIPMASDAQKGKFIFNILNDTYMNKYTYEGANDGQPYPNLEDDIELNEIVYGMDLSGCYHDGIEISGVDYEVLFPREKIDQILTDVIGSTVQDCEKMNKDGLARTSNNYILSNYEYYGNDLIGNKGRGTQFSINSVNVISGDNIEIHATYIDEALDGECSVSYKLQKNPNSFYGYKVNSYQYSGCSKNDDWYGSDFPMQLVYGIDDFIITDQKELARGEIENRSIDLNDDGIQENFTISRDSTNGLKIMGVMLDKGVNFIDDFTGNILDSNNELLPGLSVGMYFGDFDNNGAKNVLIVIGDKKTFLEGVVYGVRGNNLKYLGHLNGKSYIEFVPYNEDSDYNLRGPEYVLHLPYSTIDGKCNVVNLHGESIYDIDNSIDENTENENTETTSRPVQQCYECGDKPVIYLYPQETTNVSVKLNFKGNLLATYPLYDDSIKGWNVIANPDGTLTDLNGNEYSYLFREGKFADTDRDFSKGFVVKGEDTIEFLQNILAKIGLTPREYNEFIVYRYPKMKNNKYNMIYFSQDEYTDRAELTITPTPDSLLRVFMVYKPLNEYVKIPAQEIKSFGRKGFTVVEWGGSEVK